MQQSNLEDLADKIMQAATPATIAAGVELLDVELFGQGGRTVVRLTIDKSEGVGIEDCASFSRHLGDILDVHEVIQSAYVLEVSSPGLDRPLKKDSDFVWALGRRVRLTLRRKLDGRHVLRGELTGYEDSRLTVERDGETRIVDQADVARARLDMGDPFKRDQK